MHESERGTMNATVEDFTLLSPGFEIVGGATVEPCPFCGRSGIRERIDGEAKVLHRQTSELMCDGLLVTPEDCCSPESGARAN
jgi:hypothetical protein